MRDNLAGGTSSCESLIKSGDRSTKAPAKSRSAPQVLPRLTRALRETTLNKLRTTNSP